MATANKIQVVEKNEGRKIEYRQSGTKLIFGDDELMVNAAKYQKDWTVHTDICADKDGNLVIGVGVGRYYVAQLDIPPIQYEAVEPVTEMGEDQPAPKPVPIDMGEVILTLWSLDDLTKSEEE